MVDAGKLARIDVDAFAEQFLVGRYTTLAAVQADASSNFHPNPRTTFVKLGVDARAVPAMAELATEGFWNQRNKALVRTFFAPLARWIGRGLASKSFTQPHVSFSDTRYHRIRRRLRLVRWPLSFEICFPVGSRALGWSCSWIPLPEPMISLRFGTDYGLRFVLGSILAHLLSENQSS